MTRRTGPAEVELVIEDEHTETPERVKLSISIAAKGGVEVEKASSPLALTALAALSDAHAA